MPFVNGKVFPICVSLQIAKIDIDYARVAKKVDVKKLKQTMWDIITEQSKVKPTSCKDNLTFRAKMMISTLKIAVVLMMAIMIPVMGMVVVV